MIQNQASYPTLDRRGLRMGLGIELFTMLSGRGGEVFHPFGKMGYLVIGWSMY